MGNRIYADNAATTRLSHNAYEAMLPYLTEEYGNASQLYSFARSPKNALKEARSIIAECIGAMPEEIFFTSCGTESDNWAIHGAIQKKINIVTSSIEHHAILRPCQYAEMEGRNVVYLPVSKEGIISPLALNAALSNDTKLVSIMYANNEIGTIEPIAQLAETAHRHNCIFHTDAVQAVGHIHINVRDLGVDMLSASAHKFNGPKGIGFMFIKKGINWPSLIKGGAQERNHRAGTENVASIIGMAVALQENVASVDDNTRHILKLEDCVIKGLSEAGVLFKHNGSSMHIPGNMSLSFPKLEGETLLHRLDLMGVSISTGSACDSKETQISHVLSAIGLDETYAKGTVRIALNKDNTLEEATTIAKIISSTIAKTIHE